ncbi:MAG: proprotein convertase P-domain-containing protein [bacterium]
MLSSTRRALSFGAATAAAALCFLADATAAEVVRDTFHQDHRATPKIQFEPSTRISGLSGEPLARAFLAEHASEYGLTKSLAGLRPAEVRESLLGTHYTFRQEIGGIEVENARIVVSISRQDGHVYRVFNDFYPTKREAALERSAAISEEAAYDAAWNRLRPHGPLLADPSARLVWVPEGDSFRLTWIVGLELDAPYGGWEVRVDARDGRVLDTRDTRLYRLRSDLTDAPLATRIDAYSGPVSDRRAAFATRAATEARLEAELSRAPGSRAAGTGVVFDPDPRATLLNDNLQDTSPPSSFTAAYFTRNLLDISFNGTTYSLTGPWVNIINWDTPNTAPSTTTTGNWTGTRGVNSFNDAMTYFQIDQSQRYMQSLGFVGATGIQDGPIGTDTDGVQGADNSFFQPASNRLSFGHGCVDDSEDTDVMLHEYGHAINHDINSSWTGGDTGAMGEGFGDYWAGSYSFSTPNGPIYHPEWIFTWDGHGTGNQCWGGRIMNAFAAQYVHTTTYGAHQSIPGGFQSDELWSTPLFQSLLELDGLGYPREDVDTIILESQFGLGSGLKMRDMANAIIATASTLFPGQPHADVFTQKFLVHNIVDIPTVVLAALEPTVTSGGGNGAADPGETVELDIEVTNDGTLGATAVSATLTSTTPGVVINQGASAYPNLPIGASGTNVTPYSITVPSGHTCGDPVALVLNVSFDDGDPSSIVLNLSLPVGVPVGAQASVSPGLSIPDNNPTGVSSTLVVSGTGGTVSSNLNVDINLTHTWIGDLIVRLTSPNGTVVTLHNRTGSSAHDIIGNYPLTLTPAQPLSAFIGGPLDGTWTMFVSDNAGQDVGTLNSWGISDVSGWDCDLLTTDAPGVTLAPATFSLEAASPNPFGASTAIRFAVPGTGADVSLEVFDIAGRHVRTLTEGFLPAGGHSATWDGRDEAGRRASAGIYFYRLESREYSATRKVVLLN